MYRVEYKRSVEKDLRRLSKPALRLVVRRIQLLARQPRPSGAIRLQGNDDLLRIRQGGYRIIYQVHDDVLTVLVIKVGHRKDVYEKY